MQLLHLMLYNKSCILHQPYAQIHYPGGCCRGQVLQLVLDLDHTIVHSVDEDRLTAEEQQQLPALQAEQAVLPQEQQTLFDLEAMRMHIKFRPGAFEFVQAAAQFFELWIFTNGCRYSHPE